MNDGFKWFGEGFHGFPRVLPEDCVVYSIYVIDSKLNDIEVRDKLREVQKAANRLTRQLLGEFIWQREAFSLTLLREAGRSFLHGCTNYGDSIDDEWLIVYILRELSQQFPFTWIRIVDRDGQFLLIEAANALPIWLSPEIADFRVWVSKGKLLIIPLEKPGGAAHRMEQNVDNITLEEAIAWIANPQRKLQHSSRIEVEAFFRLQKYPQKVADSLHNSLVRIPRKLAYVLHRNAAYISPAVEAFYLRDPVALMPLQTKEAHRLIFSPDDLVKASVKFTKVGYAKLRGQKFTAPRAWGSTQNGRASAKAKNELEMGMKLACGFEMLVSDPQNQDLKVVREMAMLLEDLESGGAQLPSDEDIVSWGLRDDEDSWLDINYEEFEKELVGKGKAKSTHRSAGFGDKGAHDNLRKMVERFEDFLQDDETGLEGAEYLDEGDGDDEKDNSSDQASTTSDESTMAVDNIDTAFNEDEFTALMREMMGIPADVMKEIMTSTSNSVSRGVDTTAERSHEELDKSSDDDDGEGIRQAMRQTEQELRDAGALDFEPHGDPNVSISQESLNMHSLQ